MLYISILLQSCIFYCYVVVIHDNVRTILRSHIYEPEKEYIMLQSILHKFIVADKHN